MKSIPIIQKRVYLWVDLTNEIIMKRGRKEGRQIGRKKQRKKRRKEQRKEQRKRKPRKKGGFIRKSSFLPLFLLFSSQKWGVFSFFPGISLQRTAKVRQSSLQSRYEGYNETSSHKIWNNSGILGTLSILKATYDN